MIKQSRIVNLQDINKIPKAGKPPRIYGYTNKDLALLLEVSEDYIRNLISSKQLDPMDLHSIINNYNWRFNKVQNIQ